MSAEDLRAAARLLRERAREATVGPWTPADDGLVWAEPPGDPVCGAEQQDDADYIALMHPPVALALARALDAMATDCTVLRCEPDVPFTTLARVVLREPS